MSIKKILTVAVLAGLIGSTAACADVTGPQQKTGVCTVTGGGSTCDPTG